MEVYEEDMTFKYQQVSGVGDRKCGVVELSTIVSTI
jgi:hypothetical protein